jgi:CspA family cold shock protein
MPKGRVKWFSTEKGIGFIIADNNKREDCFVHYSSIIDEGFKNLKEGQKVSFDRKEGPKGPFAENVVAVE